MADPRRTALLSEAGARGAKVRLLGTNPDDRRALTAAASAARSAQAAERNKNRRTLAQRIADVEAALPTMPAEERARQELWLAEIREHGERITELRQSAQAAAFAELADQLEAS